MEVASVCPEAAASVLRQLLRRAMDGDLALETLEREWPIEGVDDEFLRQVHADTLNAVHDLEYGHIPEQLWDACEEHRLLYLDFVLLWYALPHRYLLSCRERIAECLPHSAVDIEREVAACLEVELACE